MTERKKLCILHWMPVEFFPPAINMARYFAAQDHWDVSLCTNRNHLSRPDFAYPAIRLVRGTFPSGKRGLGRLWAYLSFHLKATLHLLTERPQIVLYMEPHSALPVFLARLCFLQCRLFIHYHEYHHPNDFGHPGMRMARWLHRLERSWLYPAATWISQTNESRLQLFLGDHPEVDSAKTRVLPNYPPLDWWHGDNLAWAKRNTAKDEVRLVYVGALSRADTFIEEVVIWVQSQASGRFTLDIYSYNLHPETRSWLRGVVDERIRFHETGVPYDDLPDLLRGFHAGLILYRGNTPNYVHNATNKLFEYLACGLDVIYPTQMSGVRPYSRVNSRPQVIECGFPDLSMFSYQLQGRQDLQPRDTQFCCEAELGRLEGDMLEVLQGKVLAA